MQHHCPFPVQFSDNRRCYRSGSAFGFPLVLLLVAVLAGYAGLGDAAPLQDAVRNGAPAAPVQDGLRAG